MEAVNQQRDIVFDGTMMWRAFVEQTIAMVRDHQHRYRRGPGYHRGPQGEVVERCAVGCVVHGPDVAACLNVAVYDLVAACLNVAVYDLM